MSAIRIFYDAAANGAYIALTERLPGGSKFVYACDPVAVDGMINLDFDADGRLIGIEILGAMNKLPVGLLDGVEAEES